MEAGRQQGPVKGLVISMMTTTRRRRRRIVDWWSVVR